MTGITRDTARHLVAFVHQRDEASLIGPLTREEVREIYELLLTVDAVFGPDGLMELDGSGDRYFSVSPAGQKAHISAIATAPLREVWEAMQPFRDSLRG